MVTCANSVTNKEYCGNKNGIPILCKVLSRTPSGAEEKEVIKSVLGALAVLSRCLLDCLN